MTGFSSGDIIPTGFIGAFYLSSCPLGWIPADGTSSTPDLRGQFLRGLNSFDNGITIRNDGNEDIDGISRILGSWQNDAIRNIVGVVKLSNPNQGGNGVFFIYSSSGSDANSWGAAASNSAIFNASTVVPTGSDNRPRNVALLYCMKE